VESRGFLIAAVALLAADTLGCVGPEPGRLPETASAPAPQTTADTTSAAGPQPISDTASTSELRLPPEYTLSEMIGWATMMEDGPRAVLRRAGVTIDTVDVRFGVKRVGDDSLVFLPVRTDTVLVMTTRDGWYESYPTEHVLWTPASRRELRDLLPFFHAYFSSPTMDESVIHYWGIARTDSGRVYAMRYDFRTARLDSLFLDRKDELATDYRYHFGLPQVRGNEVSFDSVVVDRTTWQRVRPK